MNSKLINTLEAKKEYLTEWLARFKKAQGVLPPVQMHIDLTDWELDALTNSPDGAEDISIEELEEKIEGDYRFLQKALPMMPDYDFSTLTDSTSVAVSGATGESGFSGYVANVGELGTQEAIAYSRIYIDRYQELQESQFRPQVVRDLVKKLGVQAIERFDRAFNAYIAFKSGIGERTAAALEMRTLIDGIKGDLFQRARSVPRENMTWKIMVQRLLKEKSGGIEENTFIAQEANRDTLINSLSDVAKDREGKSSKNLGLLWMQTLDHIYVILTLASL